MGERRRYLVGRLAVLFALSTIVLAALAPTGAAVRRRPGFCAKHPNQGVQVASGADLRAAMAAKTSPSTFCLGRGLYSLGGTPLVPQAGDAVIGKPVKVGSLGQITAPTRIVGTSPDGVFRSPYHAAPFRLENVDVSGSPGTCIHHNSGFALTLRYSRVHDCAESGAGAHGKSLIAHVEIDHNGSTALLGNTAAGLKFAFSTNITVRNAYIHDNIGSGVWWDCDEHAGTVEDSRIVRNALSGVFIEISSGDRGGFFVRNNIVQNNNLNGAYGHAGVLVADSQNVSITGNNFGRSAGRGINLLEDSRSTRGHSGCDSGFPIANITIRGNKS
jgi:Right handed beta helix region